MEIFWGVIGFFGFVLLIALNLAFTVTEFSVYGDEILTDLLEEGFKLTPVAAKITSAVIVVVLWIVALVIIAATAQAIFGEAPAREF